MGSAMILMDSQRRPGLGAVLSAKYGVNPELPEIRVPKDSAWTASACGQRDTAQGPAAVQRREVTCEYTESTAMNRRAWLRFLLPAVLRRTAPAARWRWSQARAVGSVSSSGSQAGNGPRVASKHVQPWLIALSTQASVPHFDSGKNRVSVAFQWCTFRQGRAHYQPIHRVFSGDSGSRILSCVAYCRA